MSWLEKIFPKKIRTATYDKKDIPVGVWEKCPKCSCALYQPEMECNLFVCSECKHHLRIGARQRLKMFLDKKPAPHEVASQILADDVLKFKDIKTYKDRLQAARKKTHEKDAMVVMKGSLRGLPVVTAAFEFGFMGGSMGAVVGEKFVRAVKHSIKQESPLICFTASGGARMQESLFSLMQMAKVSVALATLKEHNLPYIVVLTDPTTGGVSASLAMLGDIQIAEPDALIGFAGPRVIKNIMKEELPEGFQRSDFLLEKGMIDMIVPRKELRSTISSLLGQLLYHRTRPVKA